MQTRTCSPSDSLSWLAVRERTDSELLAKFLNRPESMAFAVIVARYAPMVWAVCQQVLHHRQDAEDAVQQTFFLLARKAASFPEKPDVGRWLKVAAYRIALKIWAKRKRREKHESRCQSKLPARPLDEALGHERYDYITTAIAHLPEQLRAAFILRFLEGKSRTETARELGWPAGTVASRIRRAKKILRRDLRSHGIIP